MKVISPVGGICSRCKKNYEPNSEIFPIKSIDFIKLWRADTSKTNSQDALDKLSMMENEIQEYTNFENKYHIFHLECWKKQKESLIDLFTHKKNFLAHDSISSSPEFTYEENDDFGSRHKSFES